MKTLKLFNAVVSRTSNEKPYVSEQGYIIESDALWAKNHIVQFYRKEKLDGYGLNKTFYKSWRTILNISEDKLLMDKIKHYFSTYGSDFQDEMYIPNEVLNLPDVKLVFKTVKSYSEEEMSEKCLDLLRSGIALKEETINDLLTVLTDELSYKFTGKENIRNKEAIVKIADMYGVLPAETLSFFRYIIYRSTDDSLLIKSDEVVEAIKQSSFNPGVQFEQFGLEKLSEIFNRFKPLFLAYKNKCPKTINKISKLSKVYHKPLIENPLNHVTRLELTGKDISWLNSATPFALFKALSACHSRMNGQYIFTYRIRNGKSFVKNNKSSGFVWANYDFLLKYCKNRFNLSGQKFFLPTDIEYALPTSEKMFVGNIPTGTKFYGKSLAIGIYWENKWAARDLDLSGLNIGGKVGWNSTYTQGKGELIYSGDITDAPNGAVEYLYAQDGLSEPTLVKNNVYSGSGNCEYKILVGKGDDINHEYMMDPAKLFMEVKCKSVQRQSILGILMPEENRQCFVLLNFGAGISRVSGNSELSINATKALYQQWRDPITFRKLVVELGGEIVDTNQRVVHDLSINKLQKDTFMKIFKQ